MYTLVVIFEWRKVKMLSYRLNLLRTSMPTDSEQSAGAGSSVVGWKAVGSY